MKDFVLGLAAVFALGIVFLGFAMVTTYVAMFPVIRYMNGGGVEWLWALPLTTALAGGMLVVLDRVVHREDS